MRVGVNALFLIPNRVGGAEVYLRSLLRELARIEPTLEFVIFTNRSNHESFAGYDRVLLNFNGWNLPYRIWAEQKPLISAASQAGVDLLFSPCYTGPMSAPFPHVLTLFDLNYIDVPESFVWPIRKLLEYSTPRLARTVDAVTTSSQFSRERIVRYLRVPPERIVVAPGAPSPAFFEPHLCSIDKPFLLFVGNTYPHKNVRRLSQAFLSIADRIPHDLVVLGRYFGAEPVRHPRIRRIGRVPFPELVGLYHGCDLFVYPTRYEGFGLPLIEALAAGARCVASTAGAVQEVGGDAVTYFDPCDEEAIARAILDALDESPEQRRRYVEAGRRRAREFTWEACARRTWEAFQLAIAGHRRRGAA